MLVDFPANLDANSVIFDYVDSSLSYFSKNIKIPNFSLTNRDREVVENTQSRVKINTKLTNLKIKSRIEGYSGEYWSNLPELR